ncbi:hypothetical protein ACL03H_05595 [Saccharopolyspora sp. MS10]|uniref:hypothetical protein n=1 Tax=Saccharopolyspora sp. MS10 TaxID=3385973 RepID=UPI0039A03225
MELPHPYRCERPVAYWIVGLALFLRHATPSRPGALPGGAEAATLCGSRIRIPFETPPPRRPRSADISARCPGCADFAAEHGYDLITWDF